MKRVSVRCPCAARSRIETPGKLKTLMKGCSRAGQRCADPAGQIGRNDLIFVIQAKEGGVEPEAAQGQRTDTRFIIPAQLRVEFDDAAG